MHCWGSTFENVTLSIYLGTGVGEEEGGSQSIRTGFHSLGIHRDVDVALSGLQYPFELKEAIRRLLDNTGLENIPGSSLSANLVDLFVIIIFSGVGEGCSEDPPPKQ